MLMRITEKIPVLIPALLLLVAVITIFLRAKNVNPSEFKRIFKTAKYLGVWTLLITFVFSCVFGVFNHIDRKRSVLAIISLNYSEASQAQNANGTRYNPAEIICDEVIEAAIEKGALENVTVKQLKDCLTVYPYVEGNATDKSKYHISTEFAIEYHASEHTKHLNSENVIILVTSAYKEYYTELYTHNFRLDDDSEKPDFTTMEYMDTVMYFEKETSAIMNYLYGMAEKNSSFKTSDNTTFNSIAGKIYQFKETQINQNLKSLILQYGLARNSSEYIDRLSYRNMMSDIERRKNQVSFDLCNDAIAMYSEEMTRIVLVPTWDKSGKYYMGRTKVGIDELSVQATAHSGDVAATEKVIMDNNLIIGKINENIASGVSYAKADELIESIYQSTKDFKKEAIKAGREFSSYRMNQCISVRIYGTNFISEMKSIILFAIFAYISFVLFKISRAFPKRS